MNNHLQLSNMLKAYERSYFANSAILFLIKTGKFPSMRGYTRINAQTLYYELLEIYKVPNEDCIVDQHYNSNKQNMRMINAILFLGKEILVSLSNSKVEVEVYYDNSIPESELIQLQCIILNHRRPDVEQKTIGIISTDNSGQLEIKYFPVQNAIENIEMYYNDDFMEFDEEIKKRIRPKNAKGIILLHGDSGTGKTSYIRHLISQNPSLKKAICIPVDLFSELSRPAFQSMLLKDGCNSLLILEDAEQLLVPRNSNSHSAISSLLNITDGLWADAVGVTIIATFNAKLPAIDLAILRKGRLLSRYEFKKLTVQKANALLSANGINYITEKEMTLAEVFNTSTPEYKNEKTYSEIGFNSNGKEHN